MRQLHIACLKVIGKRGLRMIVRAFIFRKSASSIGMSMRINNGFCVIGASIGATKEIASQAIKRFCSRTRARLDYLSLVIVSVSTPLAQPLVNYIRHKVIERVRYTSLYTFCPLLSSLKKHSTYIYICIQQQNLILSHDLIAETTFPPTFHFGAYKPLVVEKKNFSCGGWPEISRGRRRARQFKARRSTGSPGTRAREDLCAAAGKAHGFLPLSYTRAIDVYM